LETMSIIVTGGASGIGKAIATLAHGRGAHVGVLDINEEKGEALIKSLGVRSVFQTGNVLDEKSMIDAFEYFGSSLPEINGCVASAGMLPTREPIENTTLNEFKEVMDNHISGTFVTTKIAGRIMENGKGGSIVTLGSILSLRPGPVLGYGAGKAAVVNLTQALAVQWAKKNIRINAMCPGWVDTPFIRKQEEDGRDLTPILNTTPMNRLVKAEEIAELAYFLLSPASSALTGSVIVADCGISLAGGYMPYGGIP